MNDEFKAFELEALKKEHPLAKVLVHTESPIDVVALADAVGSTSAIFKAARELDAREFIIATDSGTMHKLCTLNPGKLFIEVPASGNSATCKSCAHCPWMAMNGLAGLAHVLEHGTNEVHIDPALGLRARLLIDRMLAFTAAQREGRPLAGLVPGIDGSAPSIGIAIGSPNSAKKAGPAGPSKAASKLIQRCSPEVRWSLKECPAGHTSKRIELITRTENSVSGCWTAPSFIMCKKKIFPDWTN